MTREEIEKLWVVEPYCLKTVEQEEADIKEMIDEEYERKEQENRDYYKQLEEEYYRYLEDRNYDTKR